MTNESLSNGIREYEEHFRGFDSWLRLSEAKARNGWRESAAILLGLRLESQERERNLREKFNFDPTRACLVHADVEPRIKDVDTECSFSLAVAGWLTYAGAVKVSQMVLTDKEMETTAENRIKLAALSALAWLSGYHAILSGLLGSPFEATRQAAVAAISGRTATGLRRQFVRDALRREREDLHGLLPPAVLDALSDGSGFGEMGHSVILSALKSALDGKSLTEGKDAVSGAVRAAVDEDLRERDRTLRQRGRQSKDVALSETDWLPATAREDFQLRELASREDLNTFVEKACVHLSARERNVLRIMASNPDIEGTEIARKLRITSARVTQLQQQISFRLEQIGLKPPWLKKIG